MENKNKKEGAAILENIKAEENIVPTAHEEKKPEWLLNLENKVAQLESDNKMLKEMQGKNAIKSYEDGQDKGNIKTAHFKKWDNKIVIGWEKLDYSHFNPSAPDGLRENILTNLIFEDGSKEQVNYVAFNNSQDVIHLEIISQKGDLATVRMPDGRELVVETRFLNR